MDSELRAYRRGANVAEDAVDGPAAFHQDLSLAQQPPPRDGDDALWVGGCELTTPDVAGQVLYHNAWASSEPVTAANVVALVVAARSRWKIENANNHTLKTKGYPFERNDGHGKPHLAALLASLILLAFLAHIVLDLLDRRYEAVRQHLPSRRTFFEHLRALTQYLPFESWDQLFDFMLETLQSAQPPAIPALLVDH
jgi:hypothetical protein